MNTTLLESDAKQERDKGIPKGFEGHSRRKEALKRRGILDGVANKRRGGGGRKREISIIIFDEYWIILKLTPKEKKQNNKKILPSNK